MIIDDILNKFGLKYEDLNSMEKETLNNWLQGLNKGEITLGRIKDYLSAMRDSVEQELAETKHNTRQDIFLKARLRNYMLLISFLVSPEKAKEALEKAVAGMVSNIKKV